MLAGDSHGGPRIATVASCIRRLKDRSPIWIAWEPADTWRNGGRIFHGDQIGNVSRNPSWVVTLWCELIWLDCRSWRGGVWISSLSPSRSRIKCLLGQLVVAGLALIQELLPSCFVPDLQMVPHAEDYGFARDSGRRS
jgi:hypothetical protein